MAFDEFDDIDRQLEGEFAATRAPANFASTVMRRVRVPAPSRLPELLDAIGWAGVLSMAASIAAFVIFKK